MWGSPKESGCRDLWITKAATFADNFKYELRAYVQQSSRITDLEMNLYLFTEMLAVCKELFCITHMISLGCHTVAVPWTFLSPFIGKKPGSPESDDLPRFTQPAQGRADI